MPLPEEYLLSEDRQECFIVYCCKNLVNNKIYIGYTTTSLYRRIIAHYAQSRVNKSGNYFKLALSKYKKEEMRWFVLFRSRDVLELRNKEAYYIALFKSNDRSKGYNLSSGGEKSYLNDEVKNKISIKAKARFSRGDTNPFLGKNHTEEQKEKWSTSRKGIIHNPGYKHTTDTKNKLSIIRKELCQNPSVIANMSKAQKSVQIECFSNGIIYSSIGMAARELGLNKSTIQAHLKGKLKTARGYLFCIKK